VSAVSLAAGEDVSLSVGEAVSPAGGDVVSPAGGDVVSPAGGEVVLLTGKSNPMGPLVRVSLFTFSRTCRQAAGRRPWQLSEPASSTEPPFSAGSPVHFTPAAHGVLSLAEVIVIPTHGRPSSAVHPAAAGSAGTNGPATTTTPVTVIVTGERRVPSQLTLRHSA